MTIQHYGKRRVPIDARIVTKLRQCVMHGHSLRARFNALNQSAQQVWDSGRDDQLELERLQTEIAHYHLESPQHATIAERIAVLELRVTDRRSERERLRGEAGTWAQRAAPVSEMVRGIVRELNVSAADLGIDIVDFDIRSGGSSRGTYTETVS